jgi:hypothetical protein
MTNRSTALLLACLVLACAASGAGAQTLPSEPIAFAGGRVTVGGDVSATVGSDDPGFFNFTDYEHSALRILRLDLSAAVQAGDHFALLGEVRTENVDSIVPYALYLRIRPWTSRNIDIQVGRVPPTFGAFARRTYATDNFLIGYPLAYQYLTTLRADSLPATVDELLQKRGTGWLVRYTVGNTALDKGVPLVSAFRWDTGAQLHASTRTNSVNATASLTVGTVSDPRFRENNGGGQTSARVEVRPVVGLVVGTSFARGPFIADNAARAAAAPGTDDFTQTAFGADLEYSRHYYVVRVETILSAWRVPFSKQPGLQRSLRAASESVEGRYKIAPGLYVAARLDHVGFSEVAGSQATLPWDAPVSRLEIGGGYSIVRNLLVKGSFQRNTRDGGRLARQANQIATQLVFWF